MVSIIVPIYNAAEFLPMCLTSLTHQTYRDLEIILVDDGSTDGSLAIAQQFAQADERIRVIHQTNKGQGAARNAGLEVAQGEYVVFVDADDYIDYDFVEQHLSAIDGQDMVQSGYRRVNIDGEIIEEKLPKHRWQFTVAWMKMYRREFIQSLRFEEGMCYEDVIWTVDLQLRHPRILQIDYIGYNYSLNPSSTTSVPHCQDQIRMIKLLKQRPFTGLTLYTYFKLRLHWLLKL